jgi:hypothetical protein
LLVQAEWIIRFDIKTIIALEGIDVSRDLLMLSVD